MSDINIIEIDTDEDFMNDGGVGEQPAAPKTKKRVSRVKGTVPPAPAGTMDGYEAAATAGPEPEPESARTYTRAHTEVPPAADASDTAADVTMPGLTVVGPEEDTYKKMETFLKSATSRKTPTVVRYSSGSVANIKSMVIDVPMESLYGAWTVYNADTANTDEPTEKFLEAVCKILNIQMPKSYKTIGSLDLF